MVIDISSLQPKRERVTRAKKWMDILTEVSFGYVGLENRAVKSWVGREAYAPEGFIKSVTLELTVHCGVYICLFVPISPTFLEHSPG